MAITRYVSNVTALASSGHVYPSGGTSPWKICIEAGGPAVADAAVVQDPDTVTQTTRLWIPRKGKGTHLMLCLGYSNACTPSTDPVVKVFGRCGLDDAPMILKNRTGGLSATLTTASTTDATSAVLALRYTTVDDSLHWFDSKECDEALVVIETAFAVSAGSTADSVILYKWI